MNYYDKAGNPISIEEWGRLMEDRDYATIGKEPMVIGDTPVEVSTVWIGINHNFSGEGLPIIFETMVFGGDHDQECVRYATESQAREGHAQMVAAVNR